MTADANVGRDDCTGHRLLMEEEQTEAVIVHVHVYGYIFWSSDSNHQKNQCATYARHRILASRVHIYSLLSKKKVIKVINDVCHDSQILVVHQLRSPDYTIYALGAHNINYLFLKHRVCLING